MRLAMILVVMVCMATPSPPRLSWHTLTRMPKSPNSTALKPALAGHEHGNPALPAHQNPRAHAPHAWHMLPVQWHVKPCTCKIQGQVQVQVQEQMQVKCKHKYKYKYMYRYRYKYRYACRYKCKTKHKYKYTYKCKCKYKYKYKSYAHKNMAQAPCQLRYMLRLLLLLPLWLLLLLLLRALSSQVCLGWMEPMLSCTRQLPSKSHESGRAASQCNAKWHSLLKIAAGKSGTTKLISPSLSHPTSMQKQRG